jgi:hypothetical protein
MILKCLNQINYPAFGSESPAVLVTGRTLKYIGPGEFEYKPWFVVHAHSLLRSSSRSTACGNQTAPLPTHCFSESSRAFRSTETGTKRKTQIPAAVHPEHLFRLTEGAREKLDFHCGQERLLFTT